MGVLARPEYQIRASWSYTRRIARGPRVLPLSFLFLRLFVCEIRRRDFRRRPSDRRSRIRAIVRDLFRALVETPGPGSSRSLGRR